MAAIDLVRAALRQQWSGALDNARQALATLDELGRDRERLHPGAPAAAGGPRLAALAAEECWALLATAPVGRLGFTAHSGAPVIVPVNVVVFGHSVAFRTGPGPKLLAAERGAAMVVEADSLDPGTRTGWSVCVHGHARRVVDPAQIRRLNNLGIEPWAGGPRDAFVVVRADHVAGRRLG